ncbi:hypothetical protein GCM10023322_79030 [Rugosimonospora acidiphila]|uniref:Uncharacterized protein n=1 Tax=Rugosimonospora acidiphila TaxID=556531 RepID=A0ABP9SR34_9ACTN
MHPPCRIGTRDITNPDLLHLRRVHSGGYPANMLPSLRLIWATTAGRDTTTLIEVLLAHDWEYLDYQITEEDTSPFDGEHAVAGVGMTLAVSPPGPSVAPEQVLDLLLSPADQPRVDWLYLLDVTAETIAIYQGGLFIATHPLAPESPARQATGPGQRRRAQPPIPPFGGRPGPAVAEPMAHDTPDRRRRAGWEQLLQAARDDGAAAGRALAEWWAQDTIGGRATGDVKTVARRILAGLDDGDPAILDALPPATPPAQDQPSRSDGSGGDGPPLTPRERDDLSDAYLDSAQQAIGDQVAQLCRMVLSPTGDPHDLRHLHPDELRLGSVGVFCGDWTWEPGQDGELHVPVGFVGTLIDTWNGWAVFTCTRQVAEAIVAEQERLRRDRRQDLVGRGVPTGDADQVVDGEWAILTFDGDVIVVDERGVHDDEQAIERIEPDQSGQYVVKGWSWCWQPVHPYDCDRVVGDLPTRDRQQRFVQLTHTPDMRVPHDRLTVGAMPLAPTTDPTRVLELRLDGQPVATIGTNGTDLCLEVFDDPELSVEAWRGYVGGCRYRGAPAEQQRVLRALADEYEFEVLTAGAWAVGAVLLRLLDTDGITMRTYRVMPRPAHPTEHSALRDRLACLPVPDGAEQWVVWTGSGWRWQAHPRHEGGQA